MIARLKRIYAVTFRQFIANRDPFDLMNHFYWIFVDVVIFGLLIKTVTPIGEQHTVLSSFLLNLSLLAIESRGAYGCAAALGEEFIDQSFIGIITTPIRLWEMLTANMIIGTMIAALCFFVTAFYSQLFFGINIFAIGAATMVPAILSLLWSGLILGTLASSVLIMAGKKAYGNLYSMIWFFLVFCGVYFPVKAAPVFLQKITWYIPPTHVHTAIEEYIKYGKLPTQAFATSFVLNACYTVIAALIFAAAFKYKKKRGLVSLETAM